MTTLASSNQPTHSTTCGKDRITTQLRIYCFDEMRSGKINHTVTVKNAELGKS